MILTEILNVFKENLRVIPKNLTNPALALLMTFTVLEISLQIFKLDEMDWQKWIVKKTIKTGLLIWLIKEYSYIVKEIKNGFILIGNLAIGSDITTSTYLESPSLILHKGITIATQFQEAVGWNPKTYLFFILALIIVVGFCFMTFQIIITWVEFYLLVGLSIIFIPFGALKMGESYYTNVFKTIVGCSIKVCILNVILLLSEKILLGLVVTEISFQSGVLMISTIGILAYLTLSVPALATAMLTGSPTMSANEALRTGMMGVSTAMRSAMMMKNVANKVPGATAGAVGGTVKGGIGGARTGGNIGGQIGGAVGGLFGPTGAAIGNSIGKSVGSAGGALIGGAYSGAKLGLQGAKGGVSSVLGKASSSPNNKASFTSTSGSNNNPSPTITGSTANSGNTNTSTGSNTNPGNANISTGSNTSPGNANTSTASPSNTNISTGSTANPGNTNTSTGSTASPGNTNISTGSTTNPDNTNTSTGSTTNPKNTNTSSTGNIPSNPSDKKENTKGTNAPFLTPRSKIAEPKGSRKPILNGKKINLKEK